VGDRVRVRDFEAAFLEVVAEIEFGTAHEEGAFGIDDDTNRIRFHKDVTVGGAVHEIHFVLQAGAAAADDGDAEGAAGAALFFEQGAKAIAGGVEDADELFVADAE
jgi:hypothetical protein